MVTRTLEGPLRIDREVDLRRVLDAPDGPDVLCIDMPIGLLDRAERGGRPCDRAARAFLGPGRCSSVFSPPVRGALSASCYQEACSANRASSHHAIGISQQCYGILPKIRALDALMTPERQSRVIEVHPEVSFHQLRGRSLDAGKRCAAGRRERIALLGGAWGLDVEGLIESRPRPCEGHDVLDAMIACWTAERVARGMEQRFSTTPIRDSRGLRMEIVR